MNEKPSWWDNNKHNVAEGLQSAGITTQFISGLGSAWSSYIDAKGKAYAYQQDAAMSRYKAGEYAADAKSIMASAGDEILEGRERTAARGLQLAQDIGQIYAGAAGAGIDVSSATVKHVEKGVREQGTRDINAIARQNARNTQAYIQHAVQTRKNAIWANYDAKVADINADLSRKMGKISRNAGIVSAFGGLLSSAGMMIGASGSGSSGS